jgi:hypothetical protein
MTKFRYLETTESNQTTVMKKLRTDLTGEKLLNIQFRICLPLTNKNVKIEIHVIVILPRSG